MNNTKPSLVKRDLNVLWHPCSQMKDYENFPPLEVEKARGIYLILKNKHKVIDAISSWWCKNLGHHHPALIKALTRQTRYFEHVILANTTNDLIVTLSERLTELSQNLTKVLYASEGSSAVEMALKLAIHARYLQNQPSKCKILALKNSYHGETLFSLAVSDVGLYRQAYENFLPAVEFIDNLPYLTSRKEALWQDSSANWSIIVQYLEAHKHEINAIIIEPIVQGASGMRIYSQDFLVRLRQWTKENDVYLIADEIMTGFGRTGLMFAYQHAGIEPDMVCLGKGLTGGMLPMSAVLTTERIYSLFYADYELGRSFLHSHTFAGNALAAAVALEVLTLFKQEDILMRAQALEQEMFSAMQEVCHATKQLQNVRAIGGIVAADLLSTESRLGYAIFQQAVTLGAFLRPLGNTLYWLPPLNITQQQLKRLRDITIKAIQQAVY